MSTYYEILQVAPTASVQELQVAIDDKYNECRRLVTHHNPTIVNQANVALQLLEKIRGTLLNTELKSIYDEALGITENQVGGLIDPEMASAPQLSSVGSVFSSMPVGGSVKRTVPTTLPTNTPAPAIDGWYCEKCNSISQVGSLFCKSCGTEIGQNCPQCGTSFEKTAQFCPECGVNPTQFIEDQKRARAEAIESRQKEMQRVLSQAEAQLSAGMYGLAKDTLGVFEGLGNKNTTDVEYTRDEIVWKKAEAIDRNANTVRKNVIKQNVTKVILGYTAVGGVVGFIAGVIELINYFDWSSVAYPFIYAIGVGVIGAIAGAIGSAVYYYKWGGRRTAQEELIYGALAPIGLVVALAIGFALFWLIIVIAVVVFAFMVWAGGG